MIPKKIDHIQIPNNVLQDTLENFRKEGLLHNESIAYWTGSFVNADAKINNVMFANSYSEFVSGQLSAKMPLSATFKIAEEIHNRKEILFAQIHSHPFEAFHSWIDDKYAISFRLGFFSIVVPYFGKNISRLNQCKIYEYVGNTNWAELTDIENSRRFEVI